MTTYTTQSEDAAIHRLNQRKSSLLKARTVKQAKGLLTFSEKFEIGKFIGRHGAVDAIGYFAYQTGWDDKRVAKECMPGRLSVWQVVALRKKLFGEIRKHELPSKAKKTLIQVATPHADQLARIEKKLDQLIEAFK